MINPILTIKNGYASVFVLITLTFLGFQSQQKPGTDIVLQDEKLSFIPKEFYIAGVVDKRDDRTAVAWLLPPATVQNNQPKAVPVDLRGGTFAAVKQFIDHNLPADKSLRPIIMGLGKFKVTETILANGRVEGHVALVMSFDMDRGEDEHLHLGDYNGSAVYTRNAGAAMDIEPTLRHVLENGLVYINNWMNRNAATNIKLAKSVNVTFADYKEKTEDDTIYYAVNRPLKWEDFKGEPGNNRYDAEVFPTIGYDEHAEVNDGVLKLKLDIKVSLPKSACWVKPGSRSDYSLNHEQRHFDIAKLAAEHFKQKIKSENLPVGNYDGYINEDYLDAYREMDDMQKQYDDETRHGTNSAAQKEWNERIDKELRELGVK